MSDGALKHRQAARLGRNTGNRFSLTHLHTHTPTHCFLVAVVAVAIVAVAWAPCVFATEPAPAGPAIPGRVLSPATRSEAARRPPVLNYSLSIEQAVETALRFSPVIREAQQDAIIAESRVGGAQAGERPSVSATLFASRSSWSNVLTTPEGAPPVNLMGVPPGNFIDQNITAMLPIYTGGRVAAAMQAARASQAASARDLETARQDAALQTRIAYRRVLYQRALVDSQRQNLAAVQEQLRLDNLRFQAGKLAEVTLYRDRTMAANAQQEVTNALRDWRQAVYSLDTIMGISLLSNLTLTSLPQGPSPTDRSPLSSQTSPLIPPAFPSDFTFHTSHFLRSSLIPHPSSFIPANLQPLLTTAEAQRPEMKAARQRTAAAAAQVNKARSAFRPQVNVMGMGDLTRGPGGFSNGVNYTIGVAAGLPIFEGGALSSAQREADAGLAKAKAGEDAERLQVDNDVAAALTNVDAAQQNIETSLTGLAQAQEDYSIQQLRFSSGKGIQLEVLDALAALTTARTSVEKARFELSVAQDQLLRATGTILPAG